MTKWAIENFDDVNGGSSHVQTSPAYDEANANREDNTVALDIVIYYNGKCQSREIYCVEEELPEALEGETELLLELARRWRIVSDRT